MQTINGKSKWKHKWKKADGEINWKNKWKSK